MVDLRSSARGSVAEELRHPEMLERVSQNESFKLHMETVRKHVGDGLQRGRPKNIAVICLDCSGMREGMAFSEVLFAAVRCKPARPDGSFICSPTGALKHVEPRESWGEFRTCGSTGGPCHKCMGTGVTKEKGGLTPEDFSLKAKAFTVAGTSAMRLYPPPAVRRHGKLLHVAHVNPSSMYQVALVFPGLPEESMNCRFDCRKKGAAQPVEFSSSLAQDVI